MIELAWMLFAGVGLGFSLVALKDANDGVHAIHNRYNGRRVVARSYRRSEVITTAKQAVLLLMGLPFALNPEPVSLSPFVVALFALNLLGLIRTTLELLDRIRLRRMLDSQDSGDHV